MNLWNINCQHFISFSWNLVYASPSVCMFLHYVMKSSILWEIVVFGKMHKLCKYWQWSIFCIAFNSFTFVESSFALFRVPFRFNEKKSSNLLIDYNWMHSIFLICLSLILRLWPTQVELKCNYRIFQVWLQLK